MEINTQEIHIPMLRIYPAHVEQMFSCSYISAWRMIDKVIKNVQSKLSEELKEHRKFATFSEFFEYYSIHKRDRDTVYTYLEENRRGGIEWKFRNDFNKNGQNIDRN